MSLLLNNRGLPATVSWKHFLPKEKKSAGRKRTEHRKLFIAPGMIEKSRGSCYLECGNTKVIAAVYGPRENMRSGGGVDSTVNGVIEGRLSCQFVISPFSAPSTGVDSGDLVAQEREAQKLSSDYESFIEECFCAVIDRSKFPKSTLDMTVLVLENDGGVLAHSLTALSCAITTAGIEMHDLLIGVNTAVIAEADSAEDMSCKYSVDPSYEDETISYENSSAPEAATVSVVTVGYLPNVNQIATINHRGQCPTGDILSNAVKKCIESCPKVYAAVQTFLKQLVKNDEL